MSKLDSFSATGNIDVPANSPLLSCTWTLWAHLLHNMSWDLASYEIVASMHTVEELMDVMEWMESHHWIEKGMFFLMRAGIEPRWEDPQNREGGCLLYRISALTAAAPLWTWAAYAAAGETLCREPNAMNAVTGITIAPKKGGQFAFKIWFREGGEDDLSFCKDAAAITRDIPELAAVADKDIVYQRHQS